MHQVLTDVLQGNFPLMIRHRLHCRILRRCPDVEVFDRRRPLPPMTEDHVVLNEVGGVGGSIDRRDSLPVEQ